jgi:hypothetical protein
LRSYLVLTPPNSHTSASDQVHHSTVVLADGFSWGAFLVPWAWLLWNRLWLAGLIVFAVQIGSGVLAFMPGFEAAGSLLGFAVSLLVGLEGRNYYGNALKRRGFTLETVIFAQDIATAEAIYFSSLPQPESRLMPISSDWAKQAKPAGGWQNAGLGLFDHGAR